MAKFTIELPDDCAEMVADFVEAVKEMHAATPRTEGGRAVDMEQFELGVEAALAKVERSAVRRLLQRLDVDAPSVTIRGKRHDRVGRYEGSYQTATGAVTVMRSLYRAHGERNGKTVDAVSLRAGVVGDGWLPRAATTMAFLVQQQPSREAHAAARQLGRLPYSRSSFERVAHEFGALHDAQHAEVEDALIAAYAVPEAARSVSVGIDRIAVPMEEPRRRPVGRPRRNAPRRPVSRNFRMAYVGTATLHDENGEALHTIRYGRMPKGDAQGLAMGLCADVAHMLTARPDLRVMRLCDGAPEMHALLSAHVNESTLGGEVEDLVDFWHVVEKLAKAAEVLKPGDAAGLSGRWKASLLHRDNAAAAILQELRASGMEGHRVGKDQPVHEAMTYLQNHDQRMNYAAARRKGLPIGSGNTEATCKSLFETRIKRGGARWKEHTGHHVVQLRALALSDRWERAASLTLNTLRAPVRVAA